jgi:oligopeptidase A
MTATSRYADSLNSTNPLLDFAGLPKFAAIKPAHVKPAIETLMDEARAVVASLTKSDAAPTWENFVTPLDDATERLSRAWGVVSHLNGVVNSPELRDAYNGMLPVVTQFWSELSQNESLYAKYKSLRADAGFKHLTAAQQKTIENELRDFRLGGAELGSADKARFQAVQEELSALMSKFNDNVLDATNAYAYYVTNEAELAGVPEDVKTTAREAAEADGKPGWKLTLHAPCYGPVMQYADSEPLRARMYRAYVTRGSELGADPAWDNSAHIDRILELRTEAARLLGYQSYAQLSLATKMAETPAEVTDFLEGMAAKSKPFAEKDWQELEAFARAELDMAVVNAWDVAHASEKLREQRYAFSDQEVKQYFPEPQVLAGLFRVVETIYGVQLTPSAAEGWHKDVRFFDVRNKDGSTKGQFYLDLYARDAKRGGAWMDDAINRRLRDGRVQHPVAYLTCNFSAPVAGKPALFTHDDVITLFHEFGHGLHQLLTEVDELSVSGINGVEWDAVELPSQFMENFCWEWDVLKHMTRHVDTGEALPRALFDKMIAAKNFQSGMGFVRQIEFALLDMRLHAQPEPAKRSLLETLADVRRQVAVIRYPDFNRMAHSFGHIFGGGYAAGYYSYKWAEVLSADAYAAFEESGVLNPETGAKFRREVLARGGSRPALESFIAFRGRKPDMEPLLRHNGMKLAA